MTNKSAMDHAHAHAHANFEIEIPEIKAATPSSEPKRPIDLGKPFDGQSFGESLVASFSAFVRRVLAPRDEEIAALKQSNAELKQTVAEMKQTIAELQEKALTYDGIYTDGKSYTKNTLTTRDGSMWLCLQHTSSRPGSDPQCWKLTAKAERR